jgi:hypothetical protein
MEKLGTDVDLNGNHVKKLKLESLLTLPSGLGVNDAGTLVFVSSVVAFYGWDGTQWLKLHT